MSLDQQDRSDLQDVIVDGHLNLRKVEQKLEKSIVEIEAFYSKHDPNEVTKGQPYQYQLEHQAEWNKLWIPVNRALAAVDELIMEKYKILFGMEIQKNQQAQPVQTGQLGSSITQIIGEQKKEQKPGFRWPWSKPKEMPTLTPFKMSTEDILQKKRIKELFYDLIVFHKFMVEYGKPMVFPDDIKLKMNWMPFEGLANYITVESNEFTVRIQAVITVISEGHEIIRRREQGYAVTVETAAAQLKEKHDQKMMF